MNNAVVWFEISVNDVLRAKKFYESVFSFQLEKFDDPNTDMYMFSSDYSKYGASGAIVKREGHVKGTNSTVVYLSCEDCSVAQAKVESAGGAVIQPKFLVEKYGYCAIVIDTEGNTIGLYSKK